MRTAFEIHVVSFVAAVQKLADQLEQGGGLVVAIASAGMDVVYPATLAYGSTKAALRPIDQLAVELGIEAFGSTVSLRVRSPRP